MAGTIKLNNATGTLTIGKEATVSTALTTRDIGGTTSQPDLNESNQSSSSSSSINAEANAPSTTWID